MGERNNHVTFWPLLPGMHGAARFEGEHRLWLERRWDGPVNGSFVLHIGMNPSIAGASQDDLTIRKDIEFTKRMGFTRMVKCNIGTLVSTDPKGLAGRVVCHSENVAVIKSIASCANKIVIATGMPPESLVELALSLFNILKPLPLECFGTTTAGWPKHSSRISYDSKLEPFWGVKS